jgi:hypothetical protein
VLDVPPPVGFSVQNPARPDSFAYVRMQLLLDAADCWNFFASLACFAFAFSLHFVLAWVVSSVVL